MKREEWGNLRSYAWIILLLSLSLAITAPVMNVATRESGDFRNHYQRALQLLDTVTHRAIGHVLFHAVVKVYRQLMPAASQEALLLASILTFMQPLPVIIFLLLKKASRQILPNIVVAVLALALTVAAPVTIWIENPDMIGYINSIVYHNPTLIALRLFVIPLSIMSLWAINMRSYHDFNQRFFWLLATAAVVMLATLSKPSYTIALFPGLFVFALWRRLKGGAVDWVFMIWGLYIPGSIVLAIEYLYVFEAGLEHGGTIMIEPLKLMRVWVPTIWRIPIQLVLSLVFPIGVYALYFDAARKNLYLNFSWIVFGVGAMYSYAFYQLGPGFKSGDFLWSGYSAVFVLMFASLLFLVEQHVQGFGNKDVKLSRRGLRLLARSGIAVSIFAIHVLSGLAYYIRFLDYTLYPR